MAPPTANSSLEKMNDSELVIAMDGYEKSLGRLTDSQLREHLTKINSQLAEQRRPLLPSLLDRLAQESQVHARSDRRASQPDQRPDRGNLTSPQSRPPSPVDLLASSQRIGRRLAAKLVLASARSAARNNE